MLRWYVALFLCTLPLGAAGQATTPRYPCVPGFYGVTVDFRAPKRSAAGWRVVWLCAGEKGGATRHFFVCPHIAGTGCDQYKFQTLVEGAIRAMNPEAKIKEVVAANVTTDCATATEPALLVQVCAEAKEDADAMLQDYFMRVAYTPPSPTPQPTGYKVLRDPFRADGKRLVYQVVSGKRGVSTGQYADADSPCDPATTIKEFGGVTFMSVLGNPALVARCVTQ